MASPRAVATILTMIAEALPPGHEKAKEAHQACDSGRHVGYKGGVPYYACYQSGQEEQFSLEKLPCRNCPHFS